MMAHVGGVPVEEFLPLLVTGAGGYVVLRVSSLWARVRPGRAKTSASEEPMNAGGSRASKRG